MDSGVNSREPSELIECEEGEEGEDGEEGASRLVPRSNADRPERPERPRRRPWSLNHRWSLLTGLRGMSAIEI